MASRSLRGPWAVLTSLGPPLDETPLSPLKLEPDTDPAPTTLPEHPPAHRHEWQSEGAAAQRLVAVANQTAVTLTRRAEESSSETARWRARESLYRAEHTKLLEEGRLLRASLEESEVQCRRAKDEAQSAQAALEGEREAIAALRERLAKTLRETEAAATALAGEETALASQRAERDALREAVEREEQERKSLAESISGMEARRREQWDEIVALGDSSERLRMEADGLRRRLAEEQQQARASAAQAEETRRALDQAAKEVQVLDATLASLQLKVEEESGAAQVLKAELEHEKQHVAEMRAAVSADRERLMRAEAERRSLSAAVEMAREARASRKAACATSGYGTAPTPASASFAAVSAHADAAALSELLKELAQRRQQLSSDVADISPHARIAAAAVGAACTCAQDVRFTAGQAPWVHGDVQSRQLEEMMRSAHEQMRALITIINRATTAVNVHKAAARQLQVHASSWSSGRLRIRRVAGRVRICVSCR